MGGVRRPGDRRAVGGHLPQPRRNGIGGRVGGQGNSGSGSDERDLIKQLLSAAAQEAAEAAEDQANEELARSIAGHAAEEHFGVSPEEAAEAIQNVLDSPDTISRPLSNGRTAYYNDNVIVIKNDNALFRSTAYQ
jgi:hypothetical protein